MPGSNELSRSGRRWATSLVLAVAAFFAWAAVAQAQVFSSPAPIKVPATGTSGPAAPYPSTIAVSGQSGAVTNVTATMTGVAHTFPGDIDVLLVGPSGQNVVLLADTGGSTDITGVNLTFDSSAPNPVPSPIVSGTFRPTNNGTFSGTPPAPAAPYGASLTLFNGTVANGNWTLYVFDDTINDVGQIAGGWSLNVTTNGPTVGVFAPTTGPAGTQVVIPGTNLTGATAVTFGGIPAAAFTVNSATQITATVPTGATSGPITVTTPNGSASSLASFQVSPPPTITGFTPVSGKVGDTVTIAGTQLTGATAITFGGIPAATFAVTSPTSMTAVVPAGAGAGTIAVTTPGGSATSTAPFAVTHARAVSMSVGKRRVTGRITATDAFTKCTADLPVRVQRQIKGRWRNVGSTLTSLTGAYSIGSTRKGARYRAVAAAKTISTGDVCAAASVSRRVRK
jgi:subtilisin-like proprotein convertase family protein